MEVQQPCDSGKPKKRKKRHFNRARSRGDVKRTGPGPGRGPSTSSDGSMRCSGRQSQAKKSGADCMRLDHLRTNGGCGASPSSPTDVNEEGTAADADVEATKVEASMSAAFGDGSGTVSSPRDGGRHKIPGDAAAIRSAADNDARKRAFGDRSSVLNSPRVFLQSSQATAAGGMISLDVGSALASGTSSRAVNSPVNTVIVIKDQQRVGLFGALFGIMLAMLLSAALLKLTLGSGCQ